MIEARTGSVRVSSSAPPPLVVAYSPKFEQPRISLYLPWYWSRTPPRAAIAGEAGMSRFRATTGAVSLKCPPIASLE